VLEETNEGIDRNFKMLQKTETAIKNAEIIITKLSQQFENISTSIVALAAENEKAADAVEKITTLDENLAQIEKRITEMNVAREWLVNSEAELNRLNKDIRTMLNLTKTQVDKESGKVSAPAVKGGATPQIRDNVISLKRQGWSEEEIASSMKLSRNEVSLILELATRD